MGHQPTVEWFTHHSGGIVGSGGNGGRIPDEVVLDDDGAVEVVDEEAADVDDELDDVKSGIVGMADVLVELDDEDDRAVEVCELEDVAVDDELPVEDPVVGRVGDWEFPVEAPAPSGINPESAAAPDKSAVCSC